MSSLQQIRAYKEGEERVQSLEKRVDDGKKNEKDTDSSALVRMRICYVDEAITLEEIGG